MAALTDAQEKRLRQLLESVTEKEEQAALSGQDSFLIFIKERASDIWTAIKDIVSRIWDEIKKAFK